MYNPQHIETFIEKVKLEAQDAAQKVFDKYNNELNEKIKNQLRKGDELMVGMGVAVLKGQRYGKAEKFLDVIADTQYWSKNISAGFHVNDIKK